MNLAPTESGLSAAAERRSDGGGSQVAPAGALIDRLAAAGVEMVLCPDVFQGLARLMKRGAPGNGAGESWDGVLVRSSELDAEDGEFFEIFSRFRGGPEVFVYRDGADGGMLEAALGRGASGELSEAVVERWIRRAGEAREIGHGGERDDTTHACPANRRGEAAERAPSDAAGLCGPGAQEVKTIHQLAGVEAGRDGDSAAGRVQKPAEEPGGGVEDEAHQEHDDEIAAGDSDTAEGGGGSGRDSDEHPVEPGHDGSRTIRVPWKNYENRPVRQRPGGAASGAEPPASTNGNEAARGEPTSGAANEVRAPGKPEPASGSGRSGANEPFVRPSPGLAESARPRRSEPLLTEEELRQLLGDDVAGFMPRWDEAGANEGGKPRGEKP